MTDSDAAIGRKIMVDELNTINDYEDMAQNASPKVAKVIEDVIDEEKVHVGEAGAIIADNDKRAVPAMKEGVKEARHIMKSFDEMLEESFEKAGKGKRSTGKNRDGSPSGPNKQPGGFQAQRDTVAGTYNRQNYVGHGDDPNYDNVTRKVNDVKTDKDGRVATRINSQLGANKGNRSNGRNGALGGTGRAANTFRNQRILLNRGQLVPTEKRDAIGRRILHDVKSGGDVAELWNSWDTTDNRDLLEAYGAWTRDGGDMYDNKGFSEYYRAKWPYVRGYQGGPTYGEITGLDAGDRQKIQEVLAKLLSTKSKAYAPAYMQAAQELGLGDTPTPLQQANAQKRAMEIIASKLTPMGASDKYVKDHKLFYDNPALMEELTSERMTPLDEDIANEEYLERISSDERFNQDLDSGMDFDDALAAYEARIADAKDAQKIQRDQALSRDRAAQEAEDAAEAEDLKRRERTLQEQLGNVKDVRGEKQIYDELKGAKQDLTDASSNERLGAQIAHGDIGSKTVDDDVKAAMDRIAGIYKGFNPEDQATWAGTLTPENIAFLNDQASKASASLAEQYPDGLPSDIGKIKGFTAETPMIDPQLGAGGAYPENFRSRNLHGLIGMLGRAIDPNYRQKLAGRQIQSEAAMDQNTLPGKVESLKGKLRQKGLNAGEYAGEGFPEAKQRAMLGTEYGEDVNTGIEITPGPPVYEKIISGKPIKSTYGTGKKGKGGDGSHNQDGADRSARQPRSSDSGTPYDAKSKKDKAEDEAEKKKNADKAEAKTAEMNRDSKIHPNKGFQPPAENINDLADEIESKYPNGKRGKNMTEGFKESMSFKDMLDERVQKNYRGQAPSEECIVPIRDPWRRVELGVGDPAEIDINDSEHTVNGPGMTVKDMPKNDGFNGPVDEDNRPPQKDSGVKHIMKSFEDMMAEKLGGSFEKIAPVELTPEVARNNLSFMDPAMVRDIYNAPFKYGPEYSKFVRENVDALGGLEAYDPTDHAKQIDENKNLLDHKDCMTGYDPEAAWGFMRNPGQMTPRSKMIDATNKNL